jgi:hypothetical protein
LRTGGTGYQQVMLASGVYIGGGLGLILLIVIIVLVLR